MSRLAIPSVDAAPAAAQPMLAAVAKQLGSVPNLFRLAANSPAVLEGYVGLNTALGRALDAKTRERIALAVAEANGCDYCLAAHTYLGLNLARLDADEIARNRQGQSNEPKADAALRFATRVVETRGQVDNADLTALRAAGFNDAQVVEIVALVALNVLTNYLNNVAQTDVDFPAVTARVA